MGCFALKKKGKNGAPDNPATTFGIDDREHVDADADADADADVDGNGDGDGDQSGSDSDFSSSQEVSLFQIKVKATRNAKELSVRSGVNGTFWHHGNHAYANSSSSSKVMNPIPAGKERVGMMECSNNNIENVHKQTALPLPSPFSSPSLSSSPSPSPSRYALPHPVDVISNRNFQDTDHEHCKRTCSDLENSKKTFIEPENSTQACIYLGYCSKKTCVDSEHHKKKAYVNSEHHNKKTCVDRGEQYKKAYVGMEPHCNEKTYVDPMVVKDDFLDIDKDPKPLPHPEVSTNVVRELKSFSLESLALACQQFSPENLVGDDTHSFYGVELGLRGKKQRSIVISQFSRSLQMDLKEWISELYTIAHKQGSHVCDLIGYHAEHGKAEHFLVYEKLDLGSVHNLMFESSQFPALDWSTRMRIAYGAAQGLASLHENHPEKTPYKDFRLSHIQVDASYDSKVVGYYLTNTQDSCGLKNTREFAYYAPEVMNSAGVTTHKGNVWSFGIVLLELLTGRKNMDERMTRENRDLVGWARPFLKEQGRLFLVIDSRLRGQFPTRGAKLIADVVLACLHPDPARRPTMKMVVEMMKSSMTLRYSRNFTGLDQQQTTDPVNDFSGLELHRLPYTDNGMMMIGRSELVPSPPPLPRWCASENLSRHCHCPHGYATSAPLERI